MTRKALALATSVLALSASADAKDYVLTSRGTLGDAQQRATRAFDRVAEEVRYAADITAPETVDGDPSVVYLLPSSAGGQCRQLRLHDAAVLGSFGRVVAAGDVDFDVGEAARVEVRAKLGFALCARLVWHQPEVELGGAGHQTVVLPRATCAGGPAAQIARSPAVAAGRPPSSTVRGPVATSAPPT